MTISIANLIIEEVLPWDRSQPQPILFVHGMWSGAWVWENYLSFFAARGYLCYALNLRGYHGSRPVPDVGKVTVYDYIVTGLPVDDAKISCPLLIVAAGDDNFTPARAVRATARKCHAICKGYPDHAHMIMLEPGWEQIAADIADWLAGIVINKQ